MNVLILGASGLVGTHTLRLALAHPAHCTCDRSYPQGVASSCETSKSGVR